MPVESRCNVFLCASLPILLNLRCAAHNLFIHFILDFSLMQAGDANGIFFFFCNSTVDNWRRILHFIRAHIEYARKAFVRQHNSDTEYTIDIDCFVFRIAAVDFCLLCALLNTKLYKTILWPPVRQRKIIPTDSAWCDAAAACVCV